MPYLEIQNPDTPYSRSVKAVNMFFLNAVDRWEVLQAHNLTDFVLDKQKKKLAGGGVKVLRQVLAYCLTPMFRLQTFNSTQQYIFDMSLTDEERTALGEFNSAFGILLESLLCSHAGIITLAHMGVSSEKAKVLAGLINSHTGSGLHLQPFRPVLHQSILMLTSDSRARVNSPTGNLIYC